MGVDYETRLIVGIELEYDQISSIADKYKVDIDDLIYFNRDELSDELKNIFEDVEIHYTMYGEDKHYFLTILYETSNHSHTDVPCAFADYNLIKNVDQEMFNRVYERLFNEDFCELQVLSVLYMS